MSISPRWVIGLHVASSVEAALKAMSNGIYPEWAVIGADLASFPTLAGSRSSVIGETD
jgi:hypothetical protein